MFSFKGPVSVHPRLWHAVLVLVIIVLFFHTIRIANEQSRVSQGQPPSPLLKDAETIPEGNTSPEELYLSRLGRELALTQEVTWKAWRISHKELGEDWPAVTEVKLNFDSVAAKTVAWDAPNRMDLYAKKRMELPVPSSPLLGKVDASDFLFGVTTTYARVRDRDYAMIKAWSRWLTDGHHHSNGASLVVMLNQARTEELDEVDQMLQATGVDCWVTTTNEPMSLARRYFELGRILKTFAANLAANGQDKRWFGLVEDDVFFPSLSHLRDRLFSYNTDGEFYIGLPSERLDWESTGESTTTYGGGAVLLTRPAISLMPNLPCFQSDPKASFKSKRWDELLYDCVMRNTQLDMHVLPGFYSPTDDFFDPNLDSYETGQRPLLLRRYAERHLLNINKAHLVTNVCGESCFMQRYLFRDNWVLVNGISIAHYPGGVKVNRRDGPGPEKRSEETAGGVHGGGKEEPSSAASEPTEDKEVVEEEHKAPATVTPARVIVDNQEDEDKAALAWSGDKDIWRLVDSAISNDKAVWQVYVKRADKKDPKASQKDSVIVLIWEHGKVHSSPPPP